MAETGGTGRREPVVRPSKFGAGYTAGGPPSPQPVPPPHPAPVPGSNRVAGAEATGTCRQSAVALHTRPDSGALPESLDTDGPRNALATVSLVLVVLVGGFLSPITLIMAHVARAQIKRTGERGADIALAALVVSYVFLFIGVVAIAVGYWLS